MEPLRTANCPKCNGTMERGFTTAAGLVGGDKAERQQSQILFVVAGTRTSSNPVRAFQQGLSDEAVDRRYRLVGSRCASCGLVEFHADGDPVG